MLQFQGQSTLSDTESPSNTAAISRLADSRRAVTAGTQIYGNHSHCRRNSTRARDRHRHCFRFNICLTPKAQAVISALASINEVNLRRAWLVLRWRPCLGSIPGAEHLFWYVTNQPSKANSAFRPSGVGKWVPASAGKAKAGVVHSVSGWTRGVQVKLRSLENACHTWAP